MVRSDGHGTVGASLVMKSFPGDDAVGEASDRHGQAGPAIFVRILRKCNRGKVTAGFNRPTGPALTCQLLGWSKDVVGNHGFIFPLSRTDPSHVIIQLFALFIEKFQ